MGRKRNKNVTPLGMVVVSILRRNGLTQCDLAAHMGVWNQEVSRFLRAQFPRAVTCEKYARALGEMTGHKLDRQQLEKMITGDRQDRFLEIFATHGRRFAEAGRLVVWECQWPGCEGDGSERCEECHKVHCPDHEALEDHNCPEWQRKALEVE